MSAKLSITMQMALDTAVVWGKLELWPCGAWTFPGCSARIKDGVFTPDRAFTWGTIKALLDRGLVRSTKEGRYIIEVEPSSSPETGI